MKFIHRKAETIFAEDPQATKIEFCLARKMKNGNWTNQTYWSQCRDFMGDAVFANATKKPVHIYLFHYTPTYKLPVTYSAFGLRFPDQETLNKFKLNFYFLDFFDYAANTKKAQLITFNDDPLTVVVHADSIWNKTTLAVSLYTFLLKCLVYQELTKTFWQNIQESTYEYTNWDGATQKRPTNEAEYLKAIDPKLIEKLVYNIKDITKKIPTIHGELNYNMFNGNVHHSSGWYFTLKWKNNEFWKELQKLEKDLK